MLQHASWKRNLATRKYSDRMRNNPLQYDYNLRNILRSRTRYPCRHTWRYLGDSVTSLPVNTDVKASLSTRDRTVRTSPALRFYDIHYAVYSWKRKKRLLDGLSLRDGDAPDYLANRADDASRARVYNLFSHGRCSSSRVASIAKADPDAEDPR